MGRVDTGPSKQFESLVSWQNLVSGRAKLEKIHSEHITVKFTHVRDIYKVSVLLLLQISLARWSQAAECLYRYRLRAGACRCDTVTMPYCIHPSICIPYLSPRPKQNPIRRFYGASCHGNSTHDPLQPHTYVVSADSSLRHEPHRRPTRRSV